MTITPLRIVEEILQRVSAEPQPIRESHFKFTFIEPANDNRTVIPVMSKKSPLPFKLELYRDIDATLRKDWVVRDFLGRNEFSVWYGRPGAGKSVIVGDLACHVAAGWDWFGHRVQPGPVLYIAAERAGVVKRRFAAFRQYHEGRADNLPIGIVSGYIDLCSPTNHAPELLRMIANYEDSLGQPIVLVVVDTVARVMAGGDENGPKEMGSFLAKIGQVQAATDAHILAIHHPPTEGPPRLRGHGSLLGALDATVLVKKNAKDRTAIVEKQNDGEEGVSVSFDLESVTLCEATDDEGPTSAPIVVPVNGNLAGLVQDVAPKRGPTGKNGQALKALRKAISKEGQEPPPGSPGFPDSVTVVSREAWRESYYADCFVDRAADKDAVRKSFGRATQALVRGEHVCNVGEWFWPA